MFYLTEQRKKYSNSNVIMHETSQYNVEVSVFVPGRCIGDRKLIGNGLYWLK